MSRYYSKNTEEEVLKIAAKTFTGDPNHHLVRIDFDCDSYEEGLDSLEIREEFKDINPQLLKQVILESHERIIDLIGYGKKTQKVIFLDIDGVLNHQLMWKHKENVIRTSEGEVSKECVERLNHITSETGAGIVVSSTWRKCGYEEDGMTPKVFAALREAGITGELLDITPSFHGNSSIRGNEILSWLKANRPLKFNGYVILDDDSDMLYWQKDNYFWIDPYCGLTPGRTYQIINFLGQKHDECMTDPIGEIE